MQLQNLPWYGQFLVFLFIGVVLFVIFYFVHYAPTQDTLKGIMQESEGLVEDIRKGELAEKRLAKLEEENMKNEENLDKLKGILPERKEISQILRKIQAVASNARLRMTIFNPQNEIIKDIYGEWPIIMTVDGSFHNLGIFFDQLSRLTKIFNINGLTIKPLPQMSNEFSINANFTATTYIYHEKAAVAAGPAKRRAAAPASRVKKDEGLAGEI